MPVATNILSLLATYGLRETFNILSSLNTTVVSRTSIKPKPQYAYIRHRMVPTNDKVKKNATSLNALPMAHNPPQHIMICELMSNVKVMRTRGKTMRDIKVYREVEMGPNNKGKYSEQELWLEKKEFIGGVRQTVRLRRRLRSENVQREDRGTDRCRRERKTSNAIKKEGKKRKNGVSTQRPECNHEQIQVPIQKASFSQTQPSSHMSGSPPTDSLPTPVRSTSSALKPNRSPPAALRQSSHPRPKPPCSVTAEDRLDLFYVMGSGVGGESKNSAKVSSPRDSNHHYRKIAAQNSARSQLRSHSQALSEPKQQNVSPMFNQPGMTAQQSIQFVFGPQAAQTQTEDSTRSRKPKPDSTVHPKSSASQYQAPKKSLGPSRPTLQNPFATTPGRPTLVGQGPEFPQSLSFVTNPCPNISPTSGQVAPVIFPQSQPRIQNPFANVDKPSTEDLNKLPREWSANSPTVVAKGPEGNVVGDIKIRRGWAQTQEGQAFLAKFREEGNEGRNKRHSTGGSSSYGEGGESRGQDGGGAIGGIIKDV